MGVRVELLFEISPDDVSFDSGAVAVLFVGSEVGGSIGVY